MPRSLVYLTFLSVLLYAAYKIFPDARLATFTLASLLALPVALRTGVIVAQRGSKAARSGSLFLARALCYPVPCLFGQNVEEINWKVTLVRWVPQICGSFSTNVGSLIREHQPQDRKC
jgi:hypothetical protein